MVKIGAIIAAGGSGSRFGVSKESLPKQFLFIKLVIQRFLMIQSVDVVICVIPKNYIHKFNSDDKVLFTEGADNRQGSVLKGLNKLQVYNPSYVLIHDAVRPYFSKNLVNNIVDSLVKGARAVAPCIRPVDSVRINGKPIEKGLVSLIQTPQGFDFDTIYSMHKKYEGLDLSDDASLCDLGQIEVKLINGEICNRKITYKDDILIDGLKTGLGFDSHEFSSDKNRKLKLCGVEISDMPGLKGVSDADVVIHSVIDGILGAIGEGDIGSHFPETSKLSKGANSMQLLQIVVRIMRERLYVVNNIDITIVCNAPKISRYREKMIEKIAKVLMIDEGSVNIKGKTTEGTNITGIAVFSNVLLKQFAS